MSRSLRPTMSASLQRNRISCRADRKMGKWRVFCHLILNMTERSRRERKQTHQKVHLQKADFKGSTDVFIKGVQYKLNSKTVERKTTFRYAKADF